MPLLVRTTTAQALTRLLSQERTPSNRAFSPRDTYDAPPELLPWRVVYWLPDKCPAVYIPKVGAIVGEDSDLDLSALTGASEDTGAPEASRDLYRGPTTPSSGASTMDVYANVTRQTDASPLKIELTAEPAPPSEMLVASILIATVHFSDAYGVVVQQFVLGALSFTGEAAKTTDEEAPVAYKVRYTTQAIIDEATGEPTGETESFFEIFSPVWYSGRTEYRPSGATVGQWFRIPNLPSSGYSKLYAVLKVTYDKVTGKAEEPTLTIVTEAALNGMKDVTLEPPLTSDRYDTTGEDGVRHFVLYIGSFTSLTTFKQVHTGVVVEKIDDVYNPNQKLYIPGAIAIVEDGGDLFLAQRWSLIHMKPDGTAEYDDAPTYVPSDFAAKIPLYFHADEHASGVVTHA